MNFIAVTTSKQFSLSARISAEMKLSEHRKLVMKIEVSKFDLSIILKYVSSAFNIKFCSNINQL